jgi:hypothetical protein
MFVRWKMRRKESLRIPQKMNLVVESLKALKQDQQILGGLLFHLHLPRGQNMKPVDMQFTGLGVRSAWLRLADLSNIAVLIIQEILSTRW